MILSIFDFIHISFVDILDIIMVAVVIYAVAYWVKGSSAVNILIAILLLFVVKDLAEGFNMQLMSFFLSTILDVGMIALIIIFQPEIRHFLMRLGTNSTITTKGISLLRKILGLTNRGANEATVDAICEACTSMAEQKTGALIVLPHESVLEHIIETGDKIDAEVSKRLLMNLFFKNSPLHDGALVISGDRIVAARCTLPITERTNIPARFGMRHKAAIGITEETDADAVIVSEETGTISFVKGGKVTPIQNINELKLLLNEALG